MLKLDLQFECVFEQKEILRGELRGYYTLLLTYLDFLGMNIWKIYLGVRGDPSRVQVRPCGASSPLRSPALDLKKPLPHSGIGVRGGVATGWMRSYRSAQLHATTAPPGSTRPRAVAPVPPSLPFPPPIPAPPLSPPRWPCLEYRDKSYCILTVLW